ncbi:6-phosphofructokinase 1 [Chitinivorax tropicus]|uniref:Pyrophosphate--fructose 6-phosphate 1-phosphotransferase n=1 Tax=Chitinivorax tropicus TaxID=714531 RepID=A0A840MPJ5_9PROT|nr:6-phosphofructokinase [Chitinivorax tropicus]MBB5018406.1 6-phosphofructokinase 1 [Chitinivorax tropicus]
MKNALYAQAGGPSAVINASAAGVIRACRRSGQIDTVFGAHFGVLGALNENLIDTSPFDDATLELLKATPAAAFGACRHVLHDLADDPREYQRLIDVFAAHDIAYFFYNGGGGSAHACQAIAQASRRLGYPIVAVHVPKTIDNDLLHTDCSPGFGSAAKYVATSIREASIDLASMSHTSSKVFILETMGRYAGWLVGACGLATEHPNDGPHLLLFPEIPFDETQFLHQVKETVERVGYCAIAVAEGLRDQTGNTLHATGQKDAAGDRQLGGVAPLLAHMVTQQLGYKCHWAVADYLQRAARHLASATDVAQAYAVGEAAVAMALDGRHGLMPAIRRLSDVPYRWDIVGVPLDDIIQGDRFVPREFISASGLHLSEAGRRYLAPLIAGEDAPLFKHGLPQYFRLPHDRVPKKLPPFQSPLTSRVQCQV